MSLTSFPGHKINNLSIPNLLEWKQIVVEGVRSLLQCRISIMITVVQGRSLWQPIYTQQNNNKNPFNFQLHT